MDPSLPRGTRPYYEFILRQAIHYMRKPSNGMTASAALQEAGENKGWSEETAFLMRILPADKYFSKDAAVLEAMFEHPEYRALPPQPVTIKDDKGKIIFYAE